ncbi:hypothetical protein CBM2605_B10115 [Cupriavidus neocaledonicus]|uniref:Uncharacterized protein n=1 Tax=Cupriavidus neocaledonicus TaxID=1040979 RepID=A0ABY1V8J7_9BURK|nr:hypothetical protein CBM2605_B10115 [Cupriavidus neocaledonicus]
MLGPADGADPGAGGGEARSRGWWPWPLSYYCGKPGPRENPCLLVGRAPLSCGCTSIRSAMAPGPPCNLPVWLHFVLTLEIPDRPGLRVKRLCCKSLRFG